MNILLTGGTGFIGKRIIKKISHPKNKILVLTRKNIKNHNNIEYYQSNFFKPKSYISKVKTFRPEIVIHCAWFGIPDLGKKNSKINLNFSKKFFNKIIKINSIKQILISGSCFEIKEKNKRKKENCKTDINNSFSKAKIDLYNFVKTKIKKSIKFYWLRIFYAYGPGQRKESIIPYLINSIKKNKKINIKNPDYSLDFIFVDDVAEYFNKIIIKKPPSGIYNVGSGKAIKLRKIFELLKLKINKKYKYKLPKFSSTIINFYSCNKKSNNMISWKPKYNIRKGLYKTISL